MGLHNRAFDQQCGVSRRSGPTKHARGSSPRQGLDRIAAVYRSFWNEAITLGGSIEATDFRGPAPAAEAAPEKTRPKARTGRCILSPAALKEVE